MGKEEVKIIYCIMFVVEIGEKVDVLIEFVIVMLKLRIVSGRRVMINVLVDDVSVSDCWDWVLKYEGLVFFNEWMFDLKNYVKILEILVLMRCMLELLLVISLDFVAFRASGISRMFKNCF